MMLLSFCKIFLANFNNIVSGTKRCLNDTLLNNAKSALLRFLLFSKRLAILLLLFFFKSIRKLITTIAFNRNLTFRRKNCQENIGEWTAETVSIHLKIRFLRCGIILLLEKRTVIVKKNPPPVPEQLSQIHTTRTTSGFYSCNSRAYGPLSATNRL